MLSDPGYCEPLMLEGGGGCFKTFVSVFSISCAFYQMFTHAQVIFFYLTQNFIMNIIQLVSGRNCNVSVRNGKSCQEICNCNNFLFMVNLHKILLKVVYFVYLKLF